MKNITTPKAPPADKKTQKPRKPAPAKRKSHRKGTLTRKKRMRSAPEPAKLTLFQVEGKSMEARESGTFHEAPAVRFYAATSMGHVCATLESPGADISTISNIRPIGCVFVIGGKR